MSYESPSLHASDAEGRRTEVGKYTSGFDMHVSKRAIGFSLVRALVQSRTIYPNQVVLNL
jgi:hypothetical protein